MDDGVRAYLDAILPSASGRAASRLRLAGCDGGFTDRHPELSSGKGTIRLPHSGAAAIADEELQDLVRAALGP